MAEGDGCAPAEALVAVAYPVQFRLWFERNHLWERTRVGLEAARRRCAKVGRPTAEGWDDAQAHQWKAESLSAAEIARRLGVSDRRRECLRRGSPRAVSLKNALAEQVSPALPS